MAEQNTFEKTTPRATPDGQCTVYFDGSCPLCSLEIEHYSKQNTENQLRFIDVSDESFLPQEDLTQSAAMQRFHVRLADGTLVSGARGFVALWQTLPRWRWAARVAQLPGVVPILEIGYRLFLPIRPFLSGVSRRLGAKPLNNRS